MTYHTEQSAFEPEPLAFKADRFDITFDVGGVLSNSGVLMIALFANETAMHECAQGNPYYTPFDFRIIKIDRPNQPISIQFDNIPKGTYATIVYKGENQDGIINTDFLHMPVAPNAIDVCGARHFHQARFNVPINPTMIINIQYNGV